MGAHQSLALRPAACTASVMRRIPSGPMRSFAAQSPSHIWYPSSMSTHWKPSSTTLGSVPMTSSTVNVRS